MGEALGIASLVGFYLVLIVCMWRWVRNAPTVREPMEDDPE